MKYIIDGYNLLFRVSAVETTLEQERNRLIAALNGRLADYQMDITIVFDATYQEGNATRTHFGSVEVIYTNAGDTADDFIIESLRSSTHPKNVTVVTSDNRLAWRARHHLGKTISVEKFFAWINNLTGKKKEKKEPNHPSTPSTSPQNTDLQRYLEVFEHMDRNAPQNETRQRFMSEMERWLTIFEARDS